MQKNIKIGALRFDVSSDDQYLSSIKEEFEPHMTRLFQKLISPDDVVADIGANIGMTALLFSQLAKHTFSFEPAPSTFAFLQQNLTANQISNVTPFNLGLGHQHDSLTLTYATYNRSGGFVSEKTKLKNDHVTESIQIEAIDDFFDAQNITPSFLKMDVEGFEGNVIKGALRYLQKHKPVAVMEMNHFCLNVLQRIPLPDFLDGMRAAFPYLYAVDSDNKVIVDLHRPDEAYRVMLAHVTAGRFPNIVGSFTAETGLKLQELAQESRAADLPPEPIVEPIAQPQIEIQSRDLMPRIKRKVRAFLRWDIAPRN